MNWGLFKTARGFEPFSADLEHLILKFLAVCQNNLQTESILRLRFCLNNSLYKNVYMNLAARISFCHVLVVTVFLKVTVNFIAH